MKIFDLMAEMGHEQLVLGQDAASGYRGIIAIHSTTLGPALGGTRFWNYDSEEEAIVDALRLARSMTYKAAVAGLNLGGGKSVIIGDNKRTDREMLFRAHGRFVDSLAGRYVTAEDVGTSTSDMEHIHTETRFVSGLPGASGDPSPVTAHGVSRAIQAAAKQHWGSDRLSTRTVAIQGCGHVGYHLAKELHGAGAQLVASDVDAERVKSVVNDFGARGVKPDDIYGAQADIFAPCALGGIINDDTIPKLKVEIVAGAANNQLLEDRHGQALQDRGILFTPDYVANAGGVINVYSELAGWIPARALAKADEIYDTVLRVFAIATRDKVPTYVAADRLAEARIKSVAAMVRTHPQWPNK